MDSSMKARVIAALVAHEMAAAANSAEQNQRTMVIEPLPESGPPKPDPGKVIEIRSRDLLEPIATTPKTQREYTNRAPRRGKFKPRKRGR